MNNIELIQVFLLSLKSDRNLSSRTIKAYSCDLNQFNKYLLFKNIVEVDKNKIREFICFLQEKNLQSISIKRKLATLKVFYFFLKNERIIKDIPFRDFIYKFKIPQRLPKVLSRNEIEKLLRIAVSNIKLSSHLTSYKRFKTTRNRIVLEILFCAGIRIDELVKLNINHIDLDNNTMLIFGKGSKERIIYLSSKDVIEIIREYLILRVNIETDTHALLLNNRNKRLSVHSIGIIFNNFLKQCNIQKHYTPHCLRHTMATMLIENGADVRSVQEILGHSSISTTEIYISVSKHRKKEVMEKFNQRNLIMLN